MIDQTDIAIIDLLQANSRCQWKEIGQKVHLTGQAVAARVQALQDIGVIERFTVSVNEAKLGRPLSAFITVFMSSAKHAQFRDFLKEQTCIIEAHRVSGEGCYLLKARFSSYDQLNELLEQILKHGNYRVNLSTDIIKKEGD